MSSFVDAIKVLQDNLNTAIAGNNIDIKKLILGPAQTEIESKDLPILFLSIESVNEQANTANTSNNHISGTSLGLKFTIVQKTLNSSNTLFNPAETEGIYVTYKNLLNFLNENAFLRDQNGVSQLRAPIMIQSSSFSSFENSNFLQVEFESTLNLTAYSVTNR